ncbi:hypothetical protein JL721_7173 [Aureococcus anophagefferens]|nr:hypothetical protein JL721_7173 [Aureococcus anophagefferens]
MGSPRRIMNPLVALALLATARAADGNATRTYLDSIARMVDGGVEGMDAALWASIEACMGDVDGGRLLAASDAAWRGLGHYDNPADPWGSCNASTGCKEYKEMNETTLDVSGVLAHEPRNTVSNAAYYRTAANLCGAASDMSCGDRDAVVAAVAHMAFGGNAADRVLLSLSSSRDRPSAADAARGLTDLFLTRPADEWKDYIATIDVPDYFTTFAAPPSSCSRRIYGVATNDLGAALMPMVNKVANLLTGFAHADADQQRCERVYAADDRCRKLDVAPHAKWHESSANGLLDLALLADDVRKLTSTKARAASPLGRFAAPFADGWAALFLAA